MEPATVTLAARAVIAMATDKRVWKVVGTITAAILTPFVLIIVIIMSLLYAFADHNNAAIDLCFKNDVISSGMPEDYTARICNIRSSFSEIDKAVDEISSHIEEGSLDSIRAKSIFCSLFFDTNNPGMDSPEYCTFVGCFVRYKECTRTVKNKDGTEEKETRVIAVPLKSLPEIYTNLEKALGRTITSEDKINASEIYYRILYSGTIPTEGNEFDMWMDSINASSTTPFAGEKNCCSPLGENWRSMVTSEFGWRIDPITGNGAGHSGIDLGAPKGTAVRAAMSGTVLFARYKTTGYGYHLAIDHGSGVVTLYAHCSKILITEGEAVHQGDVIAEVGSTGRSTENHLHFEVRVNKEKKNPRNYLP